MKKHYFVTFMLILAMFSNVFGQQRTITGTVTAQDDGLPLPGANVIIPGKIGRAHV